MWPMSFWLSERFSQGTVPFCVRRTPSNRSSERDLARSRTGRSSANFSGLGEPECWRRSTFALPPVFSREIAKRKGRQKADPLGLSMVTAKVATVTTPSATATTEVQADARSVPVPIVAVVVVRRISITVPASADEMAMPVPAAPVIYVIDGRRFGGSRLQPTDRRSGAGRNCEAA
jgi:hypothetical protein